MIQSRLALEPNQAMQELAAERGIVSQDIDYGFLDSVRERILYHRTEGEFDWANVWSNYLAALENGVLGMYTFDELNHPVRERRVAANEVLACVGGWTHLGRELIETIEDW